MDLELCNELCKKIYFDCITAVVSCPWMSTKGLKEKQSECNRKLNQCIKSCRKEFQENKLV